MRRAVVLFLGGIFLCSSTVTRGQQVSPKPAPEQVEDQAAPNNAQDCSSSFDAIRQQRQYVERDRRQFVGVDDSRDMQAINNADLRSIELQQDLKILEQKETDLSRCAVVNNGLSAAQDSSRSCSSEPLLNFQVSHDGEPVREVPIWQLPGNTAFFYESGMTIDADGAPNAYHPDNTGLDDLANAGVPGHWQGLAKNEDGEPFVQGPDDPFPGYYVSATALSDRTKPVNDPARYVDASKIPFIVLPGGLARQLGARPGDFAAVFNLQNGKNTYAIFGDVGPFDRIGEGSMALAENLGIRSSARNGGARRGILYLVFPGSGNGRPRPIEEINAETETLLQAWRGTMRLTACTVQEPAPRFAGSQGTN
ncbi:MAG: glycoside hydrolase family 75 protein [Acidobacteriia bacterium]|nr:glycoside hydrolase family 75 protein [Terriglobia bacterium]